MRRAIVAITHPSLSRSERGARGVRQGLMRKGLVSLIRFASVTVLGACAIHSDSHSDSHSGTGGSPGSGGAVDADGSSSGGTGGGGGGSSVTIVTGSKAVNALTTDEVTQLCNDTYAYFGSAIPKETTCNWKGLSFAASSSAPTEAIAQQNCTSQQGACQQTADPWANNPGCNTIPMTCAATVAQYSACISDEASAFVQIVNGLPSCTMLTRDNSSAIFEAISSTPPASCAALSNTCPDLAPPTPLNQ